MFLRAPHALLALAVLTQVVACAEEKADPRFAMSSSSSMAADAGAKGDGGSGAKSDGGLDFASFDKALQKAIDDHNASDAGTALPVTGASAVVVDKKSGLVHQKGYGDYAADRLYLIASSSKILSVGVLMKLADEGKLDLDTPVSEYLAEWGDTAVGKVTVAQLLSNSSGLPSLTEVGGAATMPDSPFASNLCQYTSAGTLQDCGKLLYDTEPPREPDTEYAYGGSQWQLAGAIAEVVSGKSWAELIDETYVEPCKVPSLGYTNHWSLPMAATVYPSSFGGDVSKLPETENPSIEGGAYITAPDYAKLLHMHLNGGKCGSERVLSAEAVERMQQDRITEYGGKVNAPFTGYGMGWWVLGNMNSVADPGAYGAAPVIDLGREYAMMIIVEASSAVGMKLALTSKPALDAIFDKAKK